MDAAMIDRYAEGGPLLRRSIEGLTPEQFLAHPVPGTWSIQQIVLHMLDSDLIASDRMKRVIAEEHPTLIGYNETAFGERLFYDELDPFLAADVFEKNRQITTTILGKLPPEAFARTGHHNETGVITLEYLVKTYAGHLDHHLKFLREKRKLLGNPL